MRILIVGAGVAGTTLAFWLARQDHDVTVVERGGTVPASAHGVDVQDEALDVLGAMGLLDGVRALGSRVRGAVLVDGAGARVDGLPPAAFDRGLRVTHAGLLRLVRGAAAGDVRYLFDETLLWLTQDPDGVHVVLERAGRATFDLVVGADGAWSTVRHRALGPHAGRVLELGSSVAAFTTADRLGLGGGAVVHLALGGVVLLFGADSPGRMSVNLAFDTDARAADLLGRPSQEEVVRAAFAGAGWEVPRLLDDMSGAADLQLTSSCRVALDRWSVGRVALVGDAAACAAPPSGTGTSQALVGAATLARCLADAEAAGVDHAVAFAAYEERLRPDVNANQEKGREAVAMHGA